MTCHSSYFSPQILAICLAGLSTTRWLCEKHLEEPGIFGGSGGWWWLVAGKVKRRRGGS
ncbi:hypothetical protein NC651_015987 [Populus alba x Populus x berolinensis]|nr:hypothetical protein NC651_015987 [Populus alba x Populus x berolinensis]